MMIKIVLLELSNLGSKNLSVKCYINPFYLLKIFVFCIFMIIFNIS